MWKIRAMENANIQFISISPQDLADLISQEIKNEIDDIRDYITPETKTTELLTREEVCEFLKITKTTLWKYTKTGKLQAYGIGNRVWYKRAEVEQALVPLYNEKRAE